MEPSEIDLVAEVADAAPWVAQALCSSGYKADFSLESLHEIDRFFADQALDGEARPGGILSTGLVSRMFAIGTYVGEVIRRRIGGAWQAEGSDPETPLDIVLRLPQGESIHPIQRVWKRFRYGSEDGVFAYGFSIARSP